MIPVNKRFYNASFDNYICETDIQKKLIQCLKEGVEKGFKENIIITGGVGLGKTHLAYAVLNKLAEKKEYADIEWYFEEKVMYSSIKKIIDDIRKSWANNDLPDKRFKDITLLIIDEIGIQYGTESERIELYEIFNYRWENYLPIIAISNLNKEQLKKVLGQRIVDRLFDGAKVFELKGSSHRSLLNEHTLKDKFLEV